MLMIIGADHLGGIEKNLYDHGFTDISHIRGRNVADRKKINIPSNTALIVVLTDYINHMTAKYIKDQAKAQGVPMIFAKRSWCFLAKELSRCGAI